MRLRDEEGDPLYGPVDQNLLDNEIGSQTMNSCRLARTILCFAFFSVLLFLFVFDLHFLSRKAKKKNVRGCGYCLSSNCKGSSATVHQRTVEAPMRTSTPVGFLLPSNRTRHPGAPFTRCVSPRVFIVGLFADLRL